MNDFIHNLIKSAIAFKNSIHHNIFMIIGCYGLLFMVVICFSAKNFFHAELTPSSVLFLPPAWEIDGDLNFLLGTDKHGADIFSYLLIAFKTTLLLTLRATFYVIIIGAVINYLMFFIPPLRIVINTVFRLLIAIPPLLSAVIVTLLLGDNIRYILIIIGLSYLPRFVIRIHSNIMQERQKTYNTANLLDGVSLHKTLTRYIIPNIFTTYLTQVIALFSYTLLVLTMLTFLGFGRDIHNPDLGIMMQQMLEIYSLNPWGFLAPGLVIIVTILLINLLNLGTQILLTKRTGN